MPIDMSNYKMIYKEQVFNVVSVIPTFEVKAEGNTKVKFIEAWFIDEDGELKIVRDEAWCFKFVRR